MDKFSQHLLNVGEITHPLPNFNGTAVEIRNGLIIMVHTLMVCDYIFMPWLVHVRKGGTNHRGFSYRSNTNPQNCKYVQSDTKQNNKHT